MKLPVSLQFLYLRQSVGLLERVISSSQDLYVHRTTYTYTSMPRVGFEPTKRAKTVHALDHSITTTGSLALRALKNWKKEKGNSIKLNLWETIVVRTGLNQLLLRWNVVHGFQKSLCLRLKYQRANELIRDRFPRSAARKPGWYFQTSHGFFYSILHFLSNVHNYLLLPSDVKQILQLAKCQYDLRTKQAE
jgi:hypothetical protein